MKSFGFLSTPFGKFWKNDNVEQPDFTRWFSFVEDRENNSLSTMASLFFPIH
jgi:hypothetical protein